MLWAIKGLKSAHVYFTGTYNVVVRFRKGEENSDEEDGFMPVHSTSSKKRAEKKAEEARKKHEHVEIIKFKSPKGDSE